MRFWVYLAAAVGFAVADYMVPSRFLLFAGVGSIVLAAWWLVREIGREP